MRTMQLLRKALADQEVEAVLAAADRRLGEPDPIRQRAGLFVWIALCTGFRLSEIWRLRFDDFDLEHALLNGYRHKKRGPGWVREVRHSGAVRDMVVIPDALVARVKAFGEQWGLSGNGSFFRTHRRECASRSTLHKDWRIILAEANVRVRGSHAARHTFGTRIAQATRDPYAVAEALGHSDIRISIQYVAKNPALIRAALNSLDWRKGSNDQKDAA